MNKYKTEQHGRIHFLLKRNYLGFSYSVFLIGAFSGSFLAFLISSILGVTFLGFSSLSLLIKILDYYFGRNLLSHWKVVSWVFVGDDEIK